MSEISHSISDLDLERKGYFTFVSIQKTLPTLAVTKPDTGVGANISLF